MSIEATPASGGPGSGGRTAVITGAANGLGQEFCVALARRGVLVAGVDIADMADTAQAVRHAGGTFLTVTADVTTESDMARMADEVGGAFGRVDICVNNAGTYPLVAFEETTYAEWRRVLTLNLDGMFLVTKALLPLLKQSPAGRIVNVASAVVWLGPPRMVAYTTSKGGVIGFTRSLASELGPDGITVNAITPGLIPTATAAHGGHRRPRPGGGRAGDTEGPAAGRPGDEPAVPVRPGERVRDRGRHQRRRRVRQALNRQPLSSRVRAGRGSGPRWPAAPGRVHPRAGRGRRVRPGTAPGSGTGSRCPTGTARTGVPAAP
jgi:NAD(P)-dependent dehydrogenase (short-subunit alcohol dehydrogenase family)